jgi:FkbM family methyltransferase
MTGRDSLQNYLLRAYRWANRRRLLTHPWIEPLFEKTYFLYKRYWEDPYFALCRRHPELFQKGHVLDVGANLGYTSALFSRALSPGFRVFAFEPEKDNFARLEKFIFRNGLASKITPVQNAVGAEPGAARLWLNRSSHADHRVETGEFHGDAENLVSAENVSMESLDHFCDGLEGDRSITFIKIDVQGYEIEVCRGMEGVLERNPRAAVSLEYCPGMMKQMGFAPAALLEFFRGRGYGLSRLTRAGALEPLASDALKKIDAQDDYTDVLFIRP